MSSEGEAPDGEGREDRDPRDGQGERAGRGGREGQGGRAGRGERGDARGRAREGGGGRAGRTRAPRRGPRGRAEHEPIWLRPQPGERRPRHTREQIAQAALAIADAEGIEAVTMRRVAAELGAGTMTIYHYVQTKDDLLALMDDAIMAELLVEPRELAGGWRAALSAIAHRSRDAYLRHPWAIDGLRSAQIGPNGMLHAEQSIAAVADTGLDARTKFEVVAMVDEWMLGFVSRGRLEGEEPLPEAAIDYFERSLAGGDFPHMSELLEGATVRELIADLTADEAGRFERGLTRLLDGIALEIER
jgi:AcrR family transcriptional regulator